MEMNSDLEGRGGEGRGGEGRRGVGGVKCLGCGLASVGVSSY